MSGMIREARGSAGRGYTLLRQEPSYYTIVTHQTQDNLLADDDHPHLDVICNVNLSLIVLPSHLHLVSTLGS